MSPRPSLLALAALLSCPWGAVAEPAEARAEFGLAVSENGAELESRELAEGGGKVALPRGPWKCQHGKREVETVSESMVREQLALRCSLGAAVIELKVACSYLKGPARSQADVERDVQGVTLTMPNGKYRADISLSCRVKPASTPRRPSAKK